MPDEAAVVALVLIFAAGVANGACEPGAAEEAQARSVGSPGDRRLRERDSLVWEANRLAIQVDSEEAIAVARRLVPLQRELSGDSHPDVASALEVLAGVAHEFARFDEAGAALREALAIRTKAQGPDHWLTVDARYALERNDRLVGLDEARRATYREARRARVQAGKLTKPYERAGRMKLLREALDLAKGALGDSHPEYAQVLDRFALDVFGPAGNPLEQDASRREADALHAQAQALRRRALGERHPDYATSLENRFRCLPIEHDRARTKGEPLLRQALEIRKVTQGERHPVYARALVRLAQLVEAKPMGDVAEAERLCLRAMEIERQVYGPDSQLRLNALGYLTRLYRGSMHDPDRAEPLILEAVRIKRTDLAGERWADDGRWSVPLGPPMKAEGYHTQLFQMANVRHLALGMTLNDLASLYLQKGQFARAARCLDEAISALEGGFEARAAFQHGQYHDGGTARPFQIYLNLALDHRGEMEPGSVYRHVLTWKGAHLLRERRLRQWRERPEMRPLYAELQTVSADVSRMSLRPPPEGDSAAWERLHARMRRKEDLEFELAARVRQLIRDQGRSTITPEAIRDALGDDVALVDFVDVFRGYRPEGGGRGLELVAFVVRKDRPIRLVDLGPVDRLEELVEIWRARVLRGEDNPAAEARALYQQMWRPLEPHLTGARTVLVSPDRPIFRVPLVALPGKAPGTFLIEDLAVATVPVPRLLAAASPPSPSSRLLLVGDVDFGAAPGPVSSPTTPRAGGQVARLAARTIRPTFLRPLPGTRREVESIRDQFAATHPGAPWSMLRGAEATEQAFRAALPGARYVHLATHGFFLSELPSPAAQPTSDVWKSQLGLMNADPSLRSSIALAGANLPPRPGEEDGIFTALEAQQLDLGGVDLVVLSACETGLGVQAAGEGMVGLQRGFQVAGARTLISTLWSVDDAATAALMDEFYNNLWVRRLSKLEALRQAQIALMRRYDPVQKRLRRGDEVDHPAPPAGAAAPPARPRPGPVTRPEIWAAFTLSGDWR
jgi:CHAT domain-containing protein